MANEQEKKGKKTSKVILESIRVTGNSSVCGHYDKPSIHVARAERPEKVISYI